MPKVEGKGTKESPWALSTPPGTSAFHAYRDDAADPPALVVQVGKTQLATTSGRSTISTRCS